MFLLSVVVLFAGIPAKTMSANVLSTEQKYAFLVQKGIFTGFSDGSSRLNASMTREQFAVVLFRLWELTETKRSPSYNDVLKTRWSFGEIEAITAAGLMNGTGPGKFSPEANVTIEQLAVVLARAYGATGSSAATVNGKVSPWAKMAVGAALKRGWIPEQSDYRVNAARGLLVETAYAVYIDMNPDEDPQRPKLNVQSVKAVSNTSVQIDLYSSVKSVTKNQFSLMNKDGKEVSVVRIKLSDNGKRVTVTTGKQTAGEVYFLTIEGNTWAFTGYSSDNTKPRITSSKITSEAKIELVFSEAVSESTALNKGNYQLYPALGITGITLSSDKKKVTITTEKQHAGTVYTLTVRNITDIAGNVMDTRSDLYFGAVVDNTTPTISNIALGTNKIVLTFSEKLDRASAERAGNYMLDNGLGNPWSAIYDDGKMTVTLTTAPQTTGKIYTLTLNGIKDTSGNPFAPDTRRSFAGKGDYGPEPVTLLSIAAVNANELEFYFNRPLSDIPMSGMQVNLLSDNGSSVSTSDWRAYYTLKQENHQVIRAQFRTSDNSNPALFKQGHVYAASITGIAALKTSSDANRKLFAGIDIPNQVPSVTKVTAENDAAVTVFFSEPVKNVSTASFVITDVDGETIPIVSDQLSDKNNIVTSVTLNLGAKLEPGKTYQMSFNKGITDAAGWNGMKTLEGSEPYRVAFSGTDLDNEAPRIRSVIARDRYTVELEFSEPVTGAAQEVYTLYNETDRAAIRLTKGTHARYQLSEDRLKVTLSLFAGSSGPLSSGKTYTLTYDPGKGRIADLQGKRLEPVSEPVEIRFEGTDRDNARPEIIAVEGWSSVLFITLSEKVTGFTGQTNAFEIRAKGKTIVPLSASYQGNTVTLRLPKMEAGTAASVKFSSQGESAIRDLNNQKPAVRTIHYFVH
ncbi:Ig-like domain-containing protein [Paenibacillus tarimensis]